MPLTRPAARPRAEHRHIARHRVVLADGATVTLHVAAHRRSTTRVSVVRLAEPTPLARYCREHGIRDAVVGGFYVRPHGEPLGELWIGGAPLHHHAFAAPYDRIRACVTVDASGDVRVARRRDLPARPDGDLLQAGPLLLREGAYAAQGDPEGFSAGSAQFDSDITAERHPRTALALAGPWILAAACDGRADNEAGMTFPELAAALAALGATEAVNLDGGGSSSLVHDGRLRNVPRESHGVTLAGGRPVTTALTFSPR